MSLYSRLVTNALHASCFFVTVRVSLDAQQYRRFHRGIGESSNSITEIQMAAKKARKAVKKAVRRKVAKKAVKRAVVKKAVRRKVAKKRR